MPSTVYIQRPSDATARLDHDYSTLQVKSEGVDLAVFIYTPEVAEQIRDAAHQIVENFRDQAVRESHDLEQAEREAEPEPDYEPDPADLDKIDHEQEKWERRHNAPAPANRMQTVVHHGAPPTGMPITNDDIEEVRELQQSRNAVGT